MQDMPPPTAGPPVEQMPLGSRRWLNSYLFWPLYFAGVALFLALVRPWESWVSGRQARCVSVVVHEGADEGFISSMQIGTVTIVAAPVENVPAGWLLCDGRELRRDEYPELAEVLGEPRPGEEQENVFYLPDYRGLEIRMHEDSRAWYAVLNLHVARGARPFDGLTPRILHYFIKSR